MQNEGYGPYKYSIKSIKSATSEPYWRQKGNPLEICVEVEELVFLSGLFLA
jgi:hypothetical protein